MHRLIGMAGVLAFAATPALAFDASAPRDILGVVTSKGASGEFTPGEGDQGPYIEAQAGKLFFSLDFYDCEDDSSACELMTYTASWDFKGPTVDQVNRWNRYTVRCPAYLDKEGSLHSWMPVELSSALPRERMLAVQDSWLTCLSDLNDFANEPEATLLDLGV